MADNSTQPLTDPDRLSALNETALLDSEPEPAFDRITRLAGKILGVPVALVSLVTENRQFFKSNIGLLEAMRETPLSYSFCQHVVQTAEPLVIADAQNNPLVRDNLAVTEMGVRSYAGIPLITSEGHTLGSFCVLDTRPREWTEDEIATLTTLADSVLAEIELQTAVKQAQRQAREAEKARRENVALLELTAEGIFGLDRAGYCTFVNPAAARMLGFSPEALLGQNLHQLIHHHYPDGAPYPEVDCPVFHTMLTGEGCRVEDDVFWRQDGTSFPVDYCAAPLVEAGATLGAVTAFSDITARKEAEEVIRASWERDRFVAETLQHAILQEVAENAFPGLAVASRYLPAWQEARIGGDFFDVFALNGDRIAFVVGDASGKGLSAAVRMAEAKFALRAFLREDASPETALARLNDFLCAAQRLETRDEDAFIVLTLVVVKTATGEASFGTAGAEPPLILRADGRLETVTARGLPLGFLPGQTYAPQALTLGTGDMVLMATDGITEARRGMEFLGYDGMARLAQRAASASGSVQEVAQAVLDGARDFAGGLLHDDACLLLIRCVS